MKLNTLLIGGLLLIVLLVSGMGYFLIIQQNEINYISHEAREAGQISQDALDFNVENFHTQLEVWEYAFEPNAVRLEAFENHNAKLTELLKELVEGVDEEVEERSIGVYKGADKDIKKIASDLEKVRADWVGLLEKAGELQSFKESEIGEGSSEYEEIEEELLMEVNENEALFDELDFNNRVDEFVSRQKELAEELEERQAVLQSKFRNTIFFIVGFLFVIVLLIGFYINRGVSKPLNKLSNTVDEVSKGNFNVEIEKAGNIDEINNLSNSLGRIMKTMKLAVLEKKSIKKK